MTIEEDHVVRALVSNLVRLSRLVTCNVPVVHNTDLVIGRDEIARAVRHPDNVVHNLGL